MRQFFGMSQNGNLREAVHGLSSPRLILLMSNSRQFETHVKELEALYPHVPSIGCIGMSYDTSVVEDGVGVVAFLDNVDVAVNILEQVSVMPIKYIKRLELDLERIKGSEKDTVCIDFCSGNDACVLTTIHTALRKQKISLVGGTGADGKISANGRVYEDGVAYALVKNLGGRVQVYKENIYHPMGKYRFIASNTDKANYMIGALNGKPAKQVYQSILKISEQEILTQTFKNPFGKLNGNETCIISIKEVSGNSLSCFRQVNDSDVLILLELGNYHQTVRETIQRICHDFPQRSAVFSVNCLFRYKLFCKDGYMQNYLKEMSTLGSHAGLVGYGEHYNNQFINQSMSCVVFE
ncbi:MAG: hypothetical protein HFJ09_10370 [Lachnospiraceae bacterium]|nr:hypothetical protein [Lachnospiraceae bacterium]